jgi:hypothetical protein
MRRLNLTLTTLAALALSACGPEEPPEVEPGPAPDPLSRPVGGVEEEPEKTEFPDLPGPDAGLDAEAAGDDEVACCPTDFALPDALQDPDEVSAVLVGSAAPLDVEGGITLTYSDGAWRASACVPPDYQGDYHYVVSIADADGDVVFEDTRTNPNVASGFSERGEVNLWTAGAACDEIDVGVHGLDEADGI